MKCKYCGKEYIENPAKDFINSLPNFLADGLHYIPACDCLEKKKVEQFAMLEKERQEQCRRNRLKHFKDFSVVDEKFKESTFENAEHDKTIELAKRTARILINESESVGLFLYGKAGVGKTFSSACIANELERHNKTVIALNLGLYINKILADKGDTEKRLLEKAVEADLLIIDDMGVESVPDWVQDKIFNLIDARYRAKKSIVVTSNLKLENKGLTAEEIKSKLSIESRFSSRVADRLKEMCFCYHVQGESKRKFNNERFKNLLQEYGGDDELYN